MQGRIAITGLECGGLVDLTNGWHIKLMAVYHLICSYYLVGCCIYLS
jgi:hypothetical protein